MAGNDGNEKQQQQQSWDYYALETGSDPTGEAWSVKSGESPPIQIAQNCGDLASSNVAKTRDLGT